MKAVEDFLLSGYKKEGGKHSPFFFVAALNK
jgi:hypothetical protein